LLNYAAAPIIAPIIKNEAQTAKIKGIKLKLFTVLELSNVPQLGQSSLKELHIASHV
tara:strand:- start:372 stop:542 length:171 start_codon:yes stop_codon:yes gene_type:complete